MEDRDLEMFEALAGDLLDELGYERVYSNISPEIAARAEYFRKWWTDKDNQPVRAYWH